MEHEREFDDHLENVHLIVDELEALQLSLHRASYTKRMLLAAGSSGFSKDTVRDVLLPLVEAGIQKPDKRGLPLPPMQKLLLALRFYATGNIQTASGGLFGVAQRAAGSIGHGVSEILAGALQEYVKLPATPAELGSTHHLPGVTSCVDGVHIPKSNPGGERGHVYMGRAVNTTMIQHMLPKVQNEHAERAYLIKSAAKILAAPSASSGNNLEQNTQIQDMAPNDRISNSTTRCPENLSNSGLRDQSTVLPIYNGSQCHEAEYDYDGLNRPEDNQAELGNFQQGAMGHEGITMPNIDDSEEEIILSTNIRDNVSEQNCSLELSVYPRGPGNTDQIESLFVNDKLANYGAFNTALMNMLTSENAKGNHFHLVEHLGLSDELEKYASIVAHRMLLRKDKSLAEITSNQFPLSLSQELADYAKWITARNILRTNPLPYAGVNLSRLLESFDLRDELEDYSKYITTSEGHSLLPSYRKHVRENYKLSRAHSKKPNYKRLLIAARAGNRKAYSFKPVMPSNQEDSTEDVLESEDTQYSDSEDTVSAATVEMEEFTTGVAFQEAGGQGDYPDPPENYSPVNTFDPSETVQNPFSVLVHREHSRSVIQTVSETARNVILALLSCFLIGLLLGNFLPAFSDGTGKPEKAGFVNATNNKTANIEDGSSLGSKLDAMIMLLSCIKGALLSGLHFSKNFGFLNTLKLAAMSALISSSVDIIFKTSLATTVGYEFAGFSIGLIIPAIISLMTDKLKPRDYGIVIACAQGLTVIGMFTTIFTSFYYGTVWFIWLYLTFIHNIVNFWAENDHETGSLRKIRFVEVLKNINCFSASEIRAANDPRSKFLKNIRQKTCHRPLIVISVLAVLQQLSGITLAGYLATASLKEHNCGIRSSMYSRMMTVTAMVVCMVLIFMTLLTSRRKHFFFSKTVYICSLIFAAAFSSKGHEGEGSCGPNVFLSIASLAGLWGGLLVPVLTCGEYLPSSIRKEGTSIIVAITCAVMAAVLPGYHHLAYFTSSSVVFGILIAFSVSSVIFAFEFLPEPITMTVVQLQQHFLHGYRYNRYN